MANPLTRPSMVPIRSAPADQAIIWELSTWCSRRRGVEARTPELEEIRVAKERLAGPRVLAGQFMEWKDELLMDITGDNGHRHVNHLHWLHPSKIVVGRSPGRTGMPRRCVSRQHAGDGGTG